MNLYTSSSGSLQGGAASELTTLSKHRSGGSNAASSSSSRHVLLPGKRSCSGVQCRYKSRLVHIRSFLQDGRESGSPHGQPDKVQPAVVLVPASEPNFAKLDSEARIIGEQVVRQEAASVLKEDSVVQQKQQQEPEVVSLVEVPAARQIVQLLTAWDSLSGKISPQLLQCQGSQLLISALKLAIPLFQRAPLSEDGRFNLSRALEVAYTLADLRMDAEAIAAGILRVAMDTTISLSVEDVERELGTGTLHLLHDCMRAKQMPNRLHSLDDVHANILRQFSLAFHDLRSLTVELAARLDVMHHIRSFPKHRQQAVALESMQVYAPLAHALGLGGLSQQLEDMAFKVLFPDSYRYVEDWLRCHWGDGDMIISESAKHLSEALSGDRDLQKLVDRVKVTGRCKSRFSTMKKLLKDGRRPDQVYDILGLRVVLSPKPGSINESEEEAGARACYKAKSIITSMWKEVPGRMKDYIAKPKQNGYSSLHLAVYLSGYGPWSLPMELQVRTEAMDAHAVAGAASHALYKGGVTDPEQVERFKTVMLAAANASSYRLQNVSAPLCGEDHIFDMFDQNKDGIISREEFESVLVGLGGDKSDAYKVLEVVDSNLDGSVDANELSEFQRQVRALPSAVNYRGSSSSSSSSKMKAALGDASQQVSVF